MRFYGQTDSTSTAPGVGNAVPTFSPHLLPQPPFLQFGIKEGGWECASVVECLSSMSEAMGSIPNTVKREII